jgi:hypothetical protein
MKYLLYCIFRRQSQDLGPVPLAVNGGSIRFVEADGLCAAVSEFHGIDSSTHVSEAIAYHRVIESFHRRFTIIPFRFGTILSEEDEIEKVLRKKSRRFGELLQELEGCDEMGIRILLNHAHEPGGERPVIDRSFSPSGASCGKTYLEAIASHYSAESQQEQVNSERTAKFCAVFQGMFTKFKSDVSELGPADREHRPGLVSLYFLVPREFLAVFREAFARMAPQEPDKIMLSGPWPPYNFVLPEDSVG